jgi:hypothetical protein
LPHEQPAHAGNLGAAYAAVLVIGGTYWLTAMARSGIAFDHLADLPQALIVSWKGASAAGLALLVLLRTSGDTRWFLGGSLMLIAIADVLLVMRGLMSGGTVFVLAHVLAIIGYFRCRDGRASALTRIVAFSVPVLTIVGVSLAVTAKSMHSIHLAYPAISGTMAACAIASRYNPLKCGLGAVLFVLSDVLFFWDFGFFDGSGAMGCLVWPAYFLGLALIAAGAIEGPRLGQQNESGGVANG